MRVLKNAFSSAHSFTHSMLLCVKHRLMMSERASCAVTTVESVTTKDRKDGIRANISSSEDYLCAAIPHEWHRKRIMTVHGGGGSEHTHTTHSHFEPNQAMTIVTCRLEPGWPPLPPHPIKLQVQVLLNIKQQLKQQSRMVIH